MLFPLERRAPFANRRGLIFVGNLNNPTNLYGLRWFMSDVWPLLRQQELELTLRVIGDADGAQALSAGLPKLLRDSAGVEVTGYVSDEQLGGLMQGLTHCPASTVREALNATDRRALCVM